MSIPEPPHVSDVELAAYLATHARAEMTLDELQAHERTGAILAPRMAEELARFRAPVDVEGALLDACHEAQRRYSNPDPAISGEGLLPCVLRPHIERAAVLAREAEGLRRVSVQCAEYLKDLERERNETRVEIDRLKEADTAGVYEIALAQIDGMTDTICRERKERSAEFERLNIEIGALQEQVRGTSNRLRLAEEAMRRALAERDELRNGVLSFIERARPAFGAVVHVCRFLPIDGAPTLCALCGNSRASHPKGDGQ